MTAQCPDEERGAWRVVVPSKNSADPFHAYCEVADTAVIGTVQSRSSSQAQSTGGGNHLQSRVEFIVDTTIRGDHAQALTVAFEGGELDGSWSRVSHQPDLAVGQRYLLFLRTSSTGVARVVGGDGGVWVLPAGADVEDAPIAALVGALCE